MIPHIFVKFYCRPVVKHAKEGGKKKDPNERINLQSLVKEDQMQRYIIHFD